MFRLKLRVVERSYSIIDLKIKKYIKPHKSDCWQSNIYTCSNQIPAIKYRFMYMLYALLFTLFNSDTTGRRHLIILYINFRYIKCTNSLGRTSDKENTFVKLPPDVFLFRTSTFYFVKHEIICFMSDTTPVCIILIIY